MSDKVPGSRAMPYWMRSRLKATTVMPIAAIVVIIGVFQVLNPAFLRYQGIVTIVYAMSYFLIAACGMTMVIMMGSFDFSVVSVVKFSALLCVLFIEDWGLWVIPLALGVSIVIGLINGVLFAKLKVPSFMATLGISVVVDGMSLLVSKGYLHIVENDQFRSLSVTFLLGLPSIFYWALGVWLACTVVSLGTPFGRRVFAIGGNPKAAALSSIDVAGHRIGVFVMSSFLAGLAGVLYMSQQGGGSVEMGQNMMIPLFASVVAGGTSLRGGTGGPQRTILGVIIITWIQSGLLMMGFGREVQVVVMGVIAIIMTVATTERGKHSRLIVVK
jgi:ribose transport system permease protein